MSKLLPLGLHFGLDEDTYHADPALGSSSLKAIHQDAIEWQFQRLHGEETDSYAKLWGSALHARVLEGRAAFERKYRIAPAKEDFSKDLLVTVEDLKDFLKGYGVWIPSKATKAELIALVLQCDDKAEIWDKIIGDFNASLEKDGGQKIEPKMAKEIAVAVQWLSRHPKVKGVMDDGAFVGGAPEVSYFYEDQGVRLKARFDYVYPSLLVDLKSFRPWQPTETRRAVVKAIRSFRYDHQSAAYRKALAAAREEFVAGTLPVHGEPPTDTFLDLLFEQDEVTWVWLMVKAKGAPTVSLVEFPTDLDVYAAAYAEMDAAIHKYAQLRDRFGDDKDWEPDPDVIILQRDDFPPSFGAY